MHVRYSFDDWLMYGLFRDLTVRKMIMVIVIKRWSKIRGSKLVQDTMTDIAEGKIPHAGPIMTELLQRAALSGDP